MWVDMVGCVERVGDVAVDDVLELLPPLCCDSDDPLLMEEGESTL